MKKLLSILICTCCLYTNVIAQNITTQEKLYYTCKVWGFAKYYHSEVSNCMVNWDSVLVDYLPKIKNTSNYTDFNNQIDSMLLAAGPMAIATIPPPTVLPAELRRNLDFSWINDPALSQSVKNKLDTIKNNYRPHPNCMVQYNSGSGGYLLFPQDSLMLNVNTHTTYPSEEERLLMLFKFWNVIRYFNPYNYVLDTSWDSTFYYQAEDFVKATTASELENAIQKITAKLDDAHVEALNYNSVSISSDFYNVPILLRYADNKYVVVKTNILGISVGDEIVSVNGLTVQQMEDSLRPYISAGNSSVFHRFMCQYILAGPYNSGISIVLNNVSVGNYTINAIRTLYGYASWFKDYYPSDSLKNTKWKTLGCNTGYVHMGNLLQSDVNMMYNDLKTKPAIIFDIRNYPNGTAPALSMLMLSKKDTFALDIIPDVDYPGTYSWYYHAFNNTSTTPYTGQVILLMDQETQSQAEYTCMTLERLPNVIKVGSQTAGADGNISRFKLTDDTYSGFTSIGIFYPNGDSTQRIGIVPDTVVHRTQAGIRAGRDEVLEKAMQIACALSVENTTSQFSTASIYPNPVNDVLYISLLTSRTVSISVTDITGITYLSKTVERTGTLQMSVASLPDGMYFLKMMSEDEERVFKFIKQ